MIEVMLDVLLLLAVKATVTVSPKLSAEPMRSCVVDGDLVLQNLNDTTTVALDRTTLKLRWQSRRSGKSGMHSSPGVIAVDAAGATKVVVTGAFTGPIVGLDRQTGSTLWTLPLPKMDAGGPGGVSGAAVRNEAGHAVVPTLGGIVTVDVATGALLSSIKTVAGTTGAAVYGDNVVFIDMAGGNARSVAKDGTELWQLRGPCTSPGAGAITCAGFQTESIPVRDGIAYLATNTAETWAVHLQSGRKRLGFEARGGAIDPPVIGEDFDDLIIVTGIVDPKKSRVVSHELTSWERLTAHERWHVDIKGQATGAAVFTDSVVVGKDRSARIYDRLTGALKETVATKGGVFWAPCVGDDGAFYVVDDSKHITRIVP